MGKSLLENIREGMTWGELKRRGLLLEPPSVPEALMEMMAQAEADMQSIMDITGVERLPPPEPAHAARIDVGEGRVGSLVVATEAPVTEEMVAAAVEAYDDTSDSVSELFGSIYRAMAAVAPVELYRADERRADAAEAQRDAWTGIAVRYKGRIHALEAELASKEVERSEARVRVIVLEVEIAERDKRNNHSIVALEAENLALKAQIAAFTAANVAKPADARKPMPANALAGRRDDPRRIGS